MAIEEIARICHEANRVYCETLGDFSQKFWETAPDWQRDSAINGVKFHQHHPDTDDAASHVNWMDEKIEDGWTYGEEKDPEKKTHPCMVSFEDLPKEQQLKDRLFRLICKALL